jgi:hypothetical protein
MVCICAYTEGIRDDLRVEGMASDRDGKVLGSVPSVMINAIVYQFRDFLMSVTALVETGGRRN